MIIEKKTIDICMDLICDFLFFNILILQSDFWIIANLSLIMITIHETRKSTSYLLVKTVSVAKLLLFVL